MPTPEGKLKSNVIAALNRAGIFWRRTQSGKVRVKGGYLNLMPNGTADFLVCFPNSRVGWLELKAPGQATAKARKEAQAAFAEQVRGLGHTYFVITSVDELLEALR